jgi:hypothetical protein
MDLEYRELQRRLETGDLDALAPIIRFWRLEGLDYEGVAQRAKELFGVLGLEIVFAYYFGITPTSLLAMVEAGFNHFYRIGETPKISLSFEEYNPGDLDMNIDGLHLIGYVDPGENFRFMVSVEHLFHGNSWTPDEWDMKELETDIESPTEAIKQLISHHFKNTINAYFESRSWEPDF